MESTGAGLKMRFLRKDRLAAIGGAVVYVLLGSLWILFSDTLLGHITRDPDFLERISVIKGLAFVLITALLLYYLVDSHVRRTSAVANRLTSSAEDLEAVQHKLQLTDFSVDNISDAIQWITLDTRFWNVNQAACSMLGYSRDEYLSLSIADIDPYFNLEEWQTHLKEIRRTGSLYQNRFHKTRDGRVFPVEIASNYIKYGEKEYYCAIVRDITERTKAEKEAAFFRSLIEYTRDPFYVLSPDEGYQMVYANRAACEHYGYDLSQLQTMTIPDWDPAFDMERIDALAQEMRDGIPARFETVHKVASGRLVPVEVTASLLVHNGREYTCGYFYDITERKAMEEALKESEARYRALSFEFQALLNGIPDGLTLLSPQLEVLWANPAAAHAVSLEPEEMIGKRCHEVRHGSSMPCEDCIAQKTFASGEALETVVVTRPTNLTFELRSVPVRDDEGRIVKVIEIGRDITDQIEAEAQRTELETKLLHARKLESLGVLAGGIAHDFNNILTGILGNLSMLRPLVPESHKARYRIDQCEQAVSQARGLTSQLLTFAKGGDPVKKIIELGPVIENAVSFALTGSSIVAEVAVADALWTVEVDENQIGQVLHNLLINAAQAMPQGGVVRVAAENRSFGPGGSPPLAEGRYVVIAIRDQGQGIALEYLEKVFDPYFTTKDTGTGLGLTSAYSIVRKHDGDIRVSSRVGGGTTFEVVLPAVREPVCVENAPAPQTITAGKGFVLVMDDEAYIREMVAEMLAFLGYDTETCGCGEELIQMYRDKAAQKHTPDAVIVDLTIRGGMGGLDAAKAILQIDPQARLIVASGYSTDPVMAHFREYGFAAALAKPFQLEDISNELARMLKK
jgi:two-component system cell cycle sensor histidine kinase/response regulator CckA